MKISKKYLPYIPIAIVIILAIIFVVNLFTNGQIQHPGKSTYISKCAQCHGDKGEGIRQLIPPLLKSDFALQNFDSIPCWLKYGMSHPILVNGKVYDQPMYPLEIDEVQIANVMNYISKEMLLSTKETTAKKVREQIKVCDVTTEK